MIRFSLPLLERLQTKPPARPFSIEKSLDRAIP